MSYRTLLMSAVLAAGASLAGLAQADIVAVPDGIAVKESDGIAPSRGMTMNQVASKFGAPVTKVAWLNHATVAPPVVGVSVLCAQVTRAVTRVSTL